MGARWRSGFSTLLAVQVLGWQGSAPAHAMEEGERARNYESHVAANLRELVPENKYHALVEELSRLRDPVSGGDLLSPEAVVKAAASPCGDSLAYLAGRYGTDAATRQALNRVNEGFQDPPVAYSHSNPWKGPGGATALVRRMVANFTEWCTFLPEISGNQSNGLQYIQYFSWFYYRNPAGQDFVQGREPGHPKKSLLTGLKFTRDFSNQRAAFLNSKASAAKVATWVKEPRIEINDYLPPDRDNAYRYESWNDFFVREIRIDPESRTIPSRPATMPLDDYPERDYIVVSPTDCIMNPLVQVLREEGVSVRRYVENPFQQDMVLDVKNIPIGLMELLGRAPGELKEKFVGGTGLSCVLMPNTYHHFHAPVNGRIVHAEIVDAGTFGYEDFPNLVPPDGNVGRPGTDFSQFQAFQRGVVIIEVKYRDTDGGELTGYVASIPVGLYTIGSVVLDEGIVAGKTVQRGYTRLGRFQYGGSLDILLFSKGLADGAVQTRLGSQITVFNVGRKP